MNDVSVVHPQLAYTLHIGLDNSVVATSLGGDFEVRVNIADLVRYLGPSEKKNKSKVCKDAHGAIVSTLRSLTARLKPAA